MKVKKYISHPQKHFGIHKAHVPPNGGNTNKLKSARSVGKLKSVISSITESINEAIPRRNEVIKAAQQYDATRSFENKLSPELWVLGVVGLRTVGYRKLQIHARIISYYLVLYIFLQTENKIICVLL